MRLPDEARFALGTFTRLPVTAPGHLDASIAAPGLALGPLVGAGLGLASGWLLLVTDVDLIARLLSATLVVALAAWFTRGLHWDGLADVADGLGSGAEPARARAIMGRSDIGPFGVLVMVFTMALQALSVAQLPAGSAALAAWVLALALGRLAVVLACGPWFSAARPDGLGAMVVGSVSGRWLAVAAASTVLIGLVAATAGPLPAGRALFWAPAAALLVAVGLGRLAQRRFGGSTGDVLGATAELATTAALLVFALA
jgi:adenosylcobinamide-GDP ribazoletransferase